MSSINLQKHFKAADKEKSGMIDFNGLQSMLDSIGKFDSSLAREFVQIIHSSKEKKCSLAQLQSKVDSINGKSATPPPSVVQSGAYTVPSILVGYWENELKSTMYINSASGVEGQFTGYYNSAVGEAIGWYPLVGRYDPAPNSGYGLTIGWTVQWNNIDGGNSHSNTVWSSQYFDSSSGGSTNMILTSWLLSFETTIENDDNSVLKGKDHFTR